MKEIALTQGKVALVDDEDYEWLNQWKWHYHGGYATRTIDSACRKLAMHTMILNPPAGFQSDHINHDTLDNRRANLRIVTPAQNSQHRRPSIRNTSGFKGVCWNKVAGRWQVIVRAGSQQVYVGLFTDKMQAARAYNEAACRLHGEYAYLNPVEATC